jgi:hypothetical protein
VGRHAPPRVEDLPEHPGVAAGLDALWGVRKMVGLNPRPRPRSTAADLLAMESVLVTLDIRTDSGEPDWSAWVTVPKRMLESMRREAGTDDPKVLSKLKTAEFLHLVHLCRGGNRREGYYPNFRRYWDRDELDRVLDLDAGAPPAPPPRARASPGPRRGDYRVGDFSSGESDMESGT